MKRAELFDRIRYLLGIYHSFDGQHANSLSVGSSVFIGFLSSAGKILIGLFMGSFIWVFSGIYAIGLAIVRLLFLCSLAARGREKQLQYLLSIALILLTAGFLFDICAMYRQFSGDVGRHYPQWIVAIASIYFIVFYILALIGLFQTKNNRDIRFYAYKVICISGALMNLVLLQRMLLSILDLSAGTTTAVNAIFSYFIGATLMLTAIILLIRCLRARRPTQE